MKEGIQFAQVDKTSKDYSRLSENIGSTGLDLPILFILDPVDNSTFLLEDEELTVKSLDRFINNYKNKKLTKYIKSLPIPKPSSEAVQTIVRKNYDEVIKGSNKDVFVMYFATWCGHCNSFKPKLEELAQRFLVNPNIKFAKIDGVNNLIEDLTVSGYPTLYLFKNGSKSSPI